MVTAKHLSSMSILITRVLRKKHNEKLSPVPVGKEWDYTICPSLAGNNCKTWLAHTNIKCSCGSRERGDMVPDPVLLQLITGLAASCVVCFIVVLLWSPWLSCSSLCGRPFWRCFQVTTAAVMRLPEVIHRWSHWKLLNHFGYPNKTGIIFRWSLGTRQAFAKALQSPRAATISIRRHRRVGAFTQAVHMLSSEQTPRVLVSCIQCSTSSHPLTHTRGFKVYIRGAHL